LILASVVRSKNSHSNDAALPVFEMLTVKKLIVKCKLVLPVLFLLYRLLWTWPGAPVEEQPDWLTLPDVTMLG